MEKIGSFSRTQCNNIVSSNSPLLVHYKLCFVIFIYILYICYDINTNKVNLVHTNLNCRILHHIISPSLPHISLLCITIARIQLLGRMIINAFVYCV